MGRQYSKQDQIKLFLHAPKNGILYPNTHSHIHTYIHLRTYCIYIRAVLVNRMLVRHSELTFPLFQIIQSFSSVHHLAQIVSHHPLHLRVHTTHNYRAAAHADILAIQYVYMYLILYKVSKLTINQFNAGMYSSIYGAHQSIYLIQ